jgi:hypothetical protein
MKCKICASNIEASFQGKILGKYNINYYHCSNCDFIQTEDPYWLKEAYLRPINYCDTGYMSRNVSYAKGLTIFLYLLFGKNGQYLDYAGGYGVFVRLMRDIGFDFCWDDKFTENIFASGFEWNQKSRVDAVTLFEVFEHFEQPMDEIENLLSISDIIIFSTELHPDPVPQPENWWYYGLEHGQHIALYSVKTFQYIGNQFDLNYLNIGSLHVLSKKNISSWKIKVFKLSKFGIHKFIGRMMTSKTWLDYKYMINVFR